MYQISKFESGQVYEIVYKDIFSGNFMTSDQLVNKQDPEKVPKLCKKFLVYIESR